MKIQSEHPNWHTHEFRCMGSHMALWLECEDADEAEDALYQAEALFVAAERRLTRFSPESELSQLNAQPGRWVPVSNVLWQVVTQALQLAQHTEGLFDPTLLNALEAAGYQRSFDQMNGEQSATPMVSSEHCLGRWQEVELNPNQHAIRLPAHIRLDLGGIGKGYTAQQVVSLLSHWGPCLVDAGGDLTAGDAPANMPGWSVGVASPSNTLSEQDDIMPVDLFQIWLTNGTLATSGIDYRRWQQNGKLVHHLIDPQTGVPAETDVLTATVLSSHAAYAEAWATAALIAGSEKGQKLLEAQEIAGAIVDQEESLSLTTRMVDYAWHVENE